jgi:hypothetical protein
MAAWLVEQYSQPNANVNAIPFAIWNTLQVTPPAGDTGPSAPHVTGATKTQENLLLSEAATFVSGPDTPSQEQFFSQFEIVTEVAPIYLHSPSQVQEFIEIAPQPGGGGNQDIAPEPAGMAMLVAGVFGGLVFTRLRKRST